MMTLNSFLKNLITVALLLQCFLALPAESSALEDEAIFAGGCFWCLEHDLEKLPGVISAESGYSGGEKVDPTYEKHDGHQESVLVRFDSSKISYANLLKEFWFNIDPFDGEGQFCDRGPSYKPVIFTKGSEQKVLAKSISENLAKELNVPSNSLKVEIRDSGRFWLAEKYHQNFAERNALKYNFYRYSCGRDKRLKEVWERINPERFQADN